MPNTITLELPPRFYDAHVAAGLTAGTEVPHTQKFVRVEADLAAFDSLVTDATDKATSTDVGVRTSAQAALNRLENVERPSATRASKNAPTSVAVALSSDLDTAQQAVEQARQALTDALEARRQIMRRMRDEGVSVYAIAKALGMTYSAAKSTIDRQAEVNV